MKTFIVFITVCFITLLTGIILNPLKHNISENIKIENTGISTVEQTTASGKNESLPPGIEKDWYSKITEDIRNSEYNITYSEKLTSYQSHKRHRI